MGTSKVHGIGLFSGENIEEGSVVWQFNPFIDQVFSIRKFRTVSQSVNTFGLQHLYASSYKRNNKYYYITDNARFINHSGDQYNIIFANDFTEVAARPIKKVKKFWKIIFYIMIRMIFSILNLIIWT